MSRKTDAVVARTIGIVGRMDPKALRQTFKGDAVA
jgi:hypothetical protein